MKEKHNDVSARVDQSACDKLIGSAQYPLNVVENRQSFPGCPKLRDQSVREFSPKEARALLVSSSAAVRSRKEPSEPNSVEEQVFSFAGSLVERANFVLEAAAKGGKDYDGPDTKHLRRIVDGGVDNLVETLDDFGIYAWNSYLRVTLKAKPKISLMSPRIDLKGIKVEIEAVGELWAKYPWWNCYQYCFKWEKIRKCDRIAQINVSPDIAIEAHATVGSVGPRVFVEGAFDRLRLDYPILDKIPLEGIANLALEGRRMFVLDASELVATMPVLKSRFTVDRIVLPNDASGIAVNVGLKQI